MYIRWIKPAAAACLMILLCLNPGLSARAVSDALAQWADSVVPSLLPFLIAAPVLTGPLVCRLLARVSGGFLRLYRLPVNSAGVVFIGLISGSPAGAAALASVPRDPSDAPGAYLRASLMASGASPAFLLGSVACGMLNQPETGALLLRSQLAAVLLTGLLIRKAGRERPVLLTHTSRPQYGAVLSAALTLLTIAGYMALFSVIAQLLCLFFGPAARTPLLALLELAGGCRAVASVCAPLSLRLPVLSAVACFGGISVCAQCLTFLRPLGIHPAEYAAGKLIQAALCALLTALQLKTDCLSDGRALFVLFLFLLIACIISSARRASRSASSASEKAS